MYNIFTINQITNNIKIVGEKLIFAHYMKAIAEKWTSIMGKKLTQIHLIKVFNKNRDLEMVIAGN